MCINLLINNSIFPQVKTVVFKIYRASDYVSQSQQPYTGFQTTQFTEKNSAIENDEVLNVIRREQELIQQKLRQKANQEYEMKLKRKQQARQSLQDFFNRKDEETKQRKIQNAAKQQQLLQQRNSQTSQGWLKVSKSVCLKQGQYQGSKDVNRMREAILHKREDQTRV